MANKWKITDSTEKQQSEQRICFYCERFYGTDYHYPRNRLVCSGVLPQWEFLWFLMREVKPTNTCNKFVLAKMWQDENTNQR